MKFRGGTGVEGFSGGYERRLPRGPNALAVHPHGGVWHAVRFGLKGDMAGRVSAAIKSPPPSLSQTHTHVTTHTQHTLALRSCRRTTSSSMRLSPERKKTHFAAERLQGNGIRPSSPTFLMVNEFSFQGNRRVDAR